MAQLRCRRGQGWASMSMKRPSRGFASAHNRKKDGRTSMLRTCWRRFAALAVAIAAWLALGQSPSLAQEQPKRGGTLVFGINSGDPPTYDCHQSTLFPIIHLLTPHYSNLLRIDLANYPKVVGDLAESWTVAPDAK